ncbi:MAG: hypothetical protein PCFJNLEI_02569 [Verrucomicrobiae bacterium]|nr:hypothetical protein [Verrucomicrobiae bacterium]
MKHTLLIAVACSTMVVVANAQQQYVFPKLGQTPEQQAKDDYDCYQWAAKQTNFDPMAAGMATPPPPASVQSGPDGSAVKGAAKGAVVGVAVGAIAGDAGKGAAIGAAAGGIGGKMRSNRQKQEAQQQQAAQAQAAAADTAKRQQEYLKAKAACLEAKGYTVK